MKEATTDSSFKVDAKDHASAEKRRVAEGEASVIIVGIVPETLGCDADTLAGNLTDHGLHHNFVGRDVEQFHLRLNLLNDVFDLGFGLRLVVLFALELLLNYVFDDVADLGRVESARSLLNANLPILLSWFKPPSVFVRWSSSELVHFNF